MTITFAMFSAAYKTVIASTYVLIAGTEGKTTSYGTAFAIAPGILATAAHVLYENAGDERSFQHHITVMRAPDIRAGQHFEQAAVIGIDAERDIGLIKIQNPRSRAYVATTSSVSMAADAGTIGFPRIHEVEMKSPIPRFQAGHLSAAYQKKAKSGRLLIYYETDFPMYGGGSGSPGFLVNGEVFGLHVASLRSGREERPEQRAFSMWMPTTAILELMEKHRVKRES